MVPTSIKNNSDIRHSIECLILCLINNNNNKISTYNN